MRDTGAHPTRLNDDALLRPEVCLPFMLYRQRGRRCTTSASTVVTSLLTVAVVGGPGSRSANRRCPPPTRERVSESRSASPAPRTPTELDQALYLRAVGGRADYYEADAILHEAFPSYEVPERAWQDTARLQQDLADRSRHQSASPVDLLVAVTAARHKLTVLHADKDFDAIARITGQPVRRID
jgi:predicted nucleic acid-binding protein